MIFHVKEVKFANLDKDFLINSNHQVIKIEKDDLYFYFKVELKESNKLLVFSNDAFNPGISTTPIFTRSNWHEDFAANCLYIDDLTIHNTDLRIGWGIGTRERFYLEDYSDIVKRIASILDIKDEYTIYFGSSSGGFMSMMLATFHKGSSAIVNNPQTYVNRYRRVFVKRLYEQIFPNMEEEYILKKYAKRFSVTNLMRLENHVPKILYIQNRLHKPDMETQYLPFCRMLDKYEMDRRKVNFLLYNDELSGHDAISRKMTKDIVNMYLNNNFIN